MRISICASSIARACCRLGGVESGSSLALNPANEASSAAGTGFNTAVRRVLALLSLSAPERDEPQAPLRRHDRRPSLPDAGASGQASLLSPDALRRLWLCLGGPLLRRQELAG